MAAKLEKLNFEIIKDKFPDFISKLSALTKIKDVAKIKITQDEIMMYSLQGESSILAFQNYTIKTSDYFIVDEFDFSLDFIFLSPKKFVKNASFYDVTSDKKIKMSISYKDDTTDDTIKLGRLLSMTDTKLKFNTVSGEGTKIRDINTSMLSERLNPDNSMWRFKLSSSDLDDIKKLSAIYEDKIISINVKDGKVIFSQSDKWTLHVSDIDENGESITFDKGFLKIITSSKDDVEFSIFDRFFLFQEDGMNLMMSFELTFDDD